MIAEAAAARSAPAPTIFDDLRAAHRLVHFWSRAEFKAIPLEFVLVPSLDAPTLVHLMPPLSVDRTGRSCHALAMLDEERKSYPLTRDDVKRAQFAIFLRGLWCQIVHQADYYTWPDAEHYGVPALYEFAPDA